jgi:hypothetical protein
MKNALIATFCILVAALLIGQRFGFVWAGGSGYDPERVSGIIGLVGVPTIDRVGKERDAVLWQSVQRGEMVRTGPGQRVMIQLSFADVVSLDENTDLIVETNTTDAIVLKLIRGRVYLDTHTAADSSGEPVTIKTNFTRSTIRYGALSVVNYDFLETVSVIPLETTADIIVRNNNPFTSDKAVNIHETNPVSVVETIFDPTAGTIAGFYDWAIAGEN